MLWVRHKMYVFFFLNLQAMNIPLKRKTLEKFVKACDSDKNGEIDYA